MPQPSKRSGDYALFVHVNTTSQEATFTFLLGITTLFASHFRTHVLPSRLTFNTNGVQGHSIPSRTPKMRFFQDFRSKLALALVVLPLGLSHPVRIRDVSISAAQVLAVAPTSGSCEGAPAAGQCRTAEQAAPMILNSFRAYGIISPNEMAAILSTIAFESGDFKYDRPTNGEAGKGTRNMQSAAFNMKFAMSIPGLGEKLSPVMTGPQGPSDPNSILELLTADDAYSFGSASWFESTQCGPTIRSGLAGGSLAGWQAYVTGCLHATPSTDRQAYWQRAVNALGAV